MLKKFLLIVFFLMLLAPAAQATVVTGWIFNSGQTYLNFFVNHNYYDRTLPFEYSHSAEVLEFVRQDLFAKEKIEDLPILIELMPSYIVDFPEKTQISINDSCQLNRGDTGEKARQIGKCYLIKAHDQTYDGLILAVLALQNLTDENKSLELDNLQKLKNSLLLDLKYYQNISMYFYPIWAPDSSKVLVSKWYQNETEYELYDLENKKITTSQKLINNPATIPFWTDDSQNIIFASLKNIVVYNLEKDQPELTVVLSELEGIEGPITQVLIKKTPELNFLDFTVDQNSLGEFHPYRINFQDQSITKSESNDLPEWADQATLGSDFFVNYLTTVAQTSADGKYLASITKVNGLRDFEVKPFNQEPITETDHDTENLNIINQTEQTSVPGPIENNNLFVLFIAILIIIVLLLTIIFIKLFNKR